MNIVGSLSGCELSLGIGAKSATVCCTSGAIHFANNSVLGIPNCSTSIALSEKPRRVRAYVSGAYPGTVLISMVSEQPRYAYLGEPNLFMQIDDDQNVTRGVYPGGLVVLGHVDIPAASASTPAEQAGEKKLSARERNNLLRVIRALAEMNKLPPRGYAESIRSQLETLGVSAPSDDTIRKAVEDARSLDS